MDYGLDGRMMMAVEPEKLKENESTSLDLENLSPIHMLELELETLAIELDDERDKSVAQTASCEKHLHELQHAELNLLECREALRKSETQLQEALSELHSRCKAAASLQEQLLQSQHLVGEAERQRSRAKEQLESKEALAGSRLEEVTSKLDKRTAELAGYQERYELLENEYSDHKALVMHQIGALEEEHEQQINRLMDQIKALEQQRRSDASTGQSQTQVVIEKKPTDDVRRNSRGKKIQEIYQRNEVRKLEEQLDFRESRITSLNHEVEALQAKVKRIPALTGKLSRLESLLSTAEKASDHENQRLARTVADLQNQNKVLTAELKSEKKRLQARIAELEQVRAQRSVVGIVFCIDISGSLAGVAEQLAKDAFRKFIEKVRSTSPASHVGVVVHASSVTSVRNISPLDATVDHIIDSTWCGGSENYHTAFSLVQIELASFATQFPAAKRTVILISDGEDIGTPGNVATFAEWGIPCHNVVVQKSATFASQETTKYATETGGITILFNGENSKDLDALVT